MLLACLLLSGCNSQRQVDLAPVRGQVTLDGEPVAGALIEFNPVGGNAKVSRGFTFTDGSYELTYLRKTKGAVLGKHRVRITTATEHAPQERLPDRYNSDTELSAEVTVGNNVIDYELKSG